jgi:hypothetical protein
MGDGGTRRRGKVCETGCQVVGGHLNIGISGVWCLVSKIQARVSTLNSMHAINLQWCHFDKCRSSEA